MSLLNNRYPHFDVINRTIGTSCCSTLNHLHNLKALLYFTKYGILTIEVGRTANG